MNTLFFHLQHQLSSCDARLCLHPKATATLKHSAASVLVASTSAVGLNEMGFGRQLRRSFRRTKKKGTSAWNSLINRDEKREAAEAAAAADFDEAEASEDSKNMPTTAKNPIVYSHVLQTYDRGFPRRASTTCTTMALSNFHR